MRVLLDENLPHKTTMTFPLYTLRSAPIHAFNPLNPPTPLAPLVRGEACQGGL